MFSDEYGFYSCSEGEEYPPPPTPAAYAVPARPRRSDCPSNGRFTFSRRAGAVAQKTGACGNACRPPWRQATGCGTGCGVCRTRWRWLDMDRLRQRHAARHPQHRRVDLHPSCLVHSTGAGSPSHPITHTIITRLVRRATLSAHSPPQVATPIGRRPNDLSVCIILRPETKCKLLIQPLMHLSIASPGVPPSPGRPRGSDCFALPGVGNLTTGWGIWPWGGLRRRGTLTDASVHCFLRVYRVGLFDHFVCPQGGDLRYIWPPAWSNPHHLPGGGGGGYRGACNW